MVGEGEEKLEGGMAEMEHLRGEGEEIQKE